MGDSLETIILASSVLYELIGPACAKLSLYLSHSYEAGPVCESVKSSHQEPLDTRTAAEFLIERLEQIQEELQCPVPQPALAPAADEQQYASFLISSKKGLLNRR